MYLPSLNPVLFAVFTDWLYCYVEYISERVRVKVEGVGIISHPNLMACQLLVNLLSTHADTQLRLASGCHYDNSYSPPRISVVMSKTVARWQHSIPSSFFPLLIAFPLLGKCRVICTPVLSVHAAACCLEVPSLTFK